jgi:hypothetical protein
LPATSGGRFAIRTPRTFAPLLQLPLLLVGTAGASPIRTLQLDAFCAFLVEFGLPFERATVDLTTGDLGALAADFLSRHFRRDEAAVEPPVEPPAPEVPVDAVPADHEPSG